MKRQLVKETVINKQTLLFYRLETGSYILGDGAFGHELMLVFDIGGGRGICPAPHAGREGERCIKTGLNPYKAHLWRLPNLPDRSEEMSEQRDML